MSWEKEEAKSRHVDFQCVKSKSITNLAEMMVEARLADLAPAGGAAAGAVVAPAPGDEFHVPLHPDGNLVNEPYPVNPHLPEQFDQE